MAIDIFGKGLVLGFSIAAPVGPIGILCIQRTLRHGRLAGFLTGMGAACADGLYGALGALGLAAMIRLAGDAVRWIQLAGGLYLLWLALHSTGRRNGGASAPSGSGMFLSTFTLTLTNPMTILSFLAIFGALGFDLGEGRTVSAMALVAGVVAGSALWWAMLSCGAGVLRQRLMRQLRWVDYVSAAVLAAFGSHVLWHSVAYFSRTT